MKKTKYTIIVPVLNEERRVKKGILELEKFVLSQLNNLSVEIIVADGGSTDKTIEIVKELEEKFENLHLREIGRGGRGAQLKETYLNTESGFFIRIDVDIPTPPSYIRELIFWLENGYDMVIGSRFAKGSKVKRTITRKILSTGYSYLTRLLFKSPVLDYQSGFKGWRAEKIKMILPEIRDKNWFFDTEVILRALEKKFKIKEIPVESEEKEGSKVDIVRDTFSMFFSLLSLKIRKLRKINH